MVSLSLIAHRHRRSLLAFAALCLTCITMLGVGASSSVAQTSAQSVLRDLPTGTSGTTAVAGVGSTVALAASSGAVHLSTTGVSFNGSYRFLPTNEGHGGFLYEGQLCDTSSDGNAVFVHATADGFGYGRRTYERDGNHHCKDISVESYQLDTPYTKSAKIQVCQDRGTLFSDLCATSTTYHR